MLDDNWIENELGIADFGDERLTKRCTKLAESLIAHCQSSILVACQGWAEIKGAYRFFAHPQVTMSRVLAPHQYATSGGFIIALHR